MTATSKLAVITLIFPFSLWIFYWILQQGHSTYFIELSVVLLLPNIYLQLNMTCQFYTVIILIGKNYCQSIVQKRYLFDWSALPLLLYTHKIKALFISQYMQYTRMVKEGDRRSKNYYSFKFTYDIRTLSKDAYWRPVYRRKNRRLVSSFYFLPNFV